MCVCVSVCVCLCMCVYVCVTDLAVPDEELQVEPDGGGAAQYRVQLGDAVLDGAVALAQILQFRRWRRRLRLFLLCKLHEENESVFHAQIQRVLGGGE